MLRASDREQFTYAYEGGRGLATYDDDVRQPADQTEEHAGVAVAPQDRSVAELVRGRPLVAEELEAEEVEGHVEFL